MANGKGLPRSLKGADTVNGGAIQDTVDVALGAAAVQLDPQPFNTRLSTSGSAGNEIAQLPAGAFPGQRKHLVFQEEGNAADVVRINGAAGVTLQSQGAVGETPAAVTNIDFDTVGEYALLEYQGNDTWNLLYTTGATS